MLIVSEAQQLSDGIPAAAVSGILAPGCLP
jgi:hypothetical protein